MAATSKVNLASITTKILALKPLPIDVTKCPPNKSLYHQILNNRQSTSERQAKQFNLGNTHCTANPIDAADFVLEREYGDSSLYVQGEHSSVFIPPTFVSNQYKKSSTAILDYDIKKDIGRLLDNSKQNSPMNWFTRELEAFMSTQHGGESIDAKDFQRWTLNLQIIYLAIVELKTDQTTLPPTTSDLRVFIQSVIAALPSPSALKTLLCKNLSAKILRKQIKQMVENNPTEDSNLQWLFGLELSDIGEKMEHWFYNQLVALKDDTLRDTVALSSLTFMTNLKSKMHKEIDFLIISWQRKLIISVELKRTVADEKVFEQLESNHRIFEERLGDQLKSGWTYFPVVCVENDALSVNSQHYVTMETEIKAWLISIFNKFPIVQTTPTSNPLDEVKDLLKILVFAIHVSKKDQVAPITTSRWVEYTSNAIENVSTSHNIIFYSSQQLAIMNNDDPSHKKVMVRGPFGVGKSILLMQKAMQLSTQSEYNGKVMCIVGVEIRATNEWNELMLANRLKMELEEDRGIFVETFDLLSNYTTLLGKVKSRDIKAIFIDECNVWKQAIKWMEEVTPLVDYLWIAPSTQSLMDGDHQKLATMFTVVEFQRNFRNSRNVVMATKSVAEKKDYPYKEGINMPPDNFPGGCAPVFVDVFEDAIKEARKRTNEGILVIVPREFDVQDFCEFLKKSGENCKAYIRTKRDFGKGQNPYKFLQEGNVLIIEEHKSLGFEWCTVVVVIEEEIGGSTFHVCNYMLRCITNLFVVNKKADGGEKSN